MATKETVMRYNLIINKLRNNNATFKEVADYLDLESEIQGYDFSISKRTFYRDLDDIRTIYNIDIQFDFSNKVYFIDFDQQPEANERILEAFDTFNALNISDRLSDFIHFENRHPQGTEYLYGLLHAIKNKLQIIFQYKKFWGDESAERIVEPYSLKESKNRWYVLAKDLKDNQVKSFALDRLSDLEITGRKFQYLQDFNINEHYKYSFGIIGPNAREPEEVILSFDPIQGKYIKTLPLHDSQEIILDDETEFRIKLKVFLTLDFIMEILSYGENVKVIQPQSLIEQLKISFNNALDLYK